MAVRADTKIVDALVVVVEEASRMLHAYSGTGRPIDRMAVLDLLGRALRPLLDPAEQPDELPEDLQAAAELAVYGIVLDDRVFDHLSTLVGRGGDVRDNGG
jgi:hypothetical protein